MLILENLLIFLLIILGKVTLPDTQFFVNLGDWPLMKNKDEALPIFSWCGSEDSYDIVLPTYDLTESTLHSMSRVSLDMLTVQKNQYKWEDKTIESQLRKSFNDPNFSYYPKAALIVYTKENKSYYAYKLAIYADVPLYGANVIVDAQSGTILAEENLIHTVKISDKF